MKDHRSCFYCVYKDAGCENLDEYSPHSRKVNNCKFWEDKHGHDRVSYTKTVSFKIRSFISKNKIVLIAAVIALLIIMLYPTLIYLIANGPPAGLGTPPEPMG